MTRVNILRRRLAGIVSFAALSVAACNGAPVIGDPSGALGWTVEAPTRLCVDHDQNRLADSRCGSSERGSWYYLGRGGFVPAVGRYVNGGTVVPMARAGRYQSTESSMAQAKAAQKGGFGSLAGKHGSGGGLVERLFSGSAN